MAAEFGKLFEKSKTEADFNESLALWRSGEISSNNFFPIIRDEFFRKELYLGPSSTNGTRLADISLQNFQVEAVNSSVLADAWQRGLTGENPEPHMVFLKRYNFIKKFSKVARRNNLYEDENGSITKLHIREFEIIDDNLPDSLLLHSHVANQTGRLYTNKQEEYYYKKLRDVVYQALPKEEESGATNILIWLNAEGLLSDIRRFKINLLLPFVEVPEELQEKRSFDDYEHLFQRFAPIVYLSAWEERINKRRHQFRNSLPEFLDDEVAKKTVSSTFFLQNKDLDIPRRTILGRVIKSIHNNGNPTEARELLAKTCAKNIADHSTPPLHQWQIDDIEIGPLIEKELENLGISVNEVVTTSPIIDEGNEASQLSETDVVTELEVSSERPNNGSQTIQIAEGEKAVNEGSTNERSSQIEEITPPKTKPSVPPAVLDNYRTETILRGLWTSEHLRQYARDLLTGKRGLLPSESYPLTLELSGPINDAIESLRNDAGQGNKGLIVVGFMNDRVTLKINKSLISGDFDDEPYGEILRIRQNIAQQQNLTNIVADIQNNFPAVPHRTTGSTSRRDYERTPSFSVDHLYRMLASKDKALFTGVIVGNTNLLEFRTKSTVDLDRQTGNITQEWFSNVWHSRHDIHYRNLSGQNSNEKSILPPDQVKEWDMDLAIAASHNLVIYRGESNRKYSRVFPD